MKAYLLFKAILGIFLFLTFSAFTQNQSSSNLKTEKIENRSANKTEKIEAKKQRKPNECQDKSKIDGLYYAKVRYVIVYNYIFDKLAIHERRMDILIDPEQLNEENLRCVFKLIENRFPTPIYRTIKVHTNLATLETPEEREYSSPSGRTRFDHTYDKYKRAFYVRFYWGREVFSYTTQLLPDYKEKQVVLVDKKMPN